MTHQLIPAIGIEAQPARLLTCALLWASEHQIREAFDTISVDDFDTPHAEIMDALHANAIRGRTGPAVIANVLLREGLYYGPIRKEMETAPLAGGTFEGIRDYAIAHLAQRFREQAAAFGNSIAEHTRTSSEHELWGAIVDGGSRLRRLAERLETLRGGAL